MLSGTLYIVATPIGNLADITLRALDTLKAVDVILCEDTRVTKKLLDHYKIQKEVLSYHHHSDTRKINEIRALLNSGKNLALVTDAGTPGISDPGNELVSVILRKSSRTTEESKRVTNLDPSPDANRVQDDSVRIVPIPGPSALVAALSVSGFPTDKFLFLGFPPHKNKRQKFFREVAAAEHTVVFYESGHRIQKCITELAGVLDPSKKMMIARELTKKFEMLYRGTITEVSAKPMDERGEFVVVIS